MNHLPSLSSNSSLTNHSKPKVKLEKVVSWRSSMKNAFQKFMKIHRITPELESIF